MSYDEAIKFLDGLQMFGARPGLGTTLKLAALASNPQDKLRFIHVAGTNGKGSTCAMLESIYRTAGLRVGLFTSPHLIAFGERIQINRQLISEADVARLVTEMQPLFKQFSQDTHPTFFEVVTVMALRYFAEQHCDLVIWETGLGGRLDATNIVTPLASVITNVHLDHQAWLGETPPQIAREKAGIIKPDVPVITAVDDVGAFRVLFETAWKNKSPFLLITWAQAEYDPLRGLTLPLIGEHQRLNAAVAAHTVRILKSRIPVSDQIIRAGLSQVQWLGRLQWVKRPSGQQVLLDGAHNTGGAETLRQAVQTYFSAQAPTLILGILRDKDYAAICAILAPLAARILLVPVGSHRTAQPHDLAAACRAANSAVTVDECKSLSAALDQSRNDRFLVITGSLYLVGEAIELLGLSPASPANERNLNEWGGQPLQP